MAIQLDGTPDGHRELRHRMSGRKEKRAIDTILATIGETSVELGCVYVGKGNTREILANHAVLVTSRKPDDALYAELGEQIDITRVGDRSHRRFVVPSLVQKRTSRPTRWVRL